MNGVMADSVSPGSSQRGARVTWTAHTIWPSGPAAAGSAPSAVLTGAGKVQLEVLRRRLSDASFDLVHGLDDGRGDRRGHSVLTALGHHVAVHVVDLSGPALGDVL